MADVCGAEEIIIKDSIKNYYKERFSERMTNNHIIKIIEDQLESAEKKYISTQDRTEAQFFYVKKLVLKDLLQKINNRDYDTLEVNHGKISTTRES